MNPNESYGDEPELEYLYNQQQNARFEQGEDEFDD